MLLWEAARQEAQNIRRFTPIRDQGLDDLKRIAATLDAEVFVEPLDPKYSGVIIKEEGEDPRIMINSLEPMLRQRFTLAHEIGHLIERTQVATDPDFSFVDTRAEDHYDLHEFFADEFAGELLMPAEEFLAAYNEMGAYGTAIKFGVSVPAVKKRGQRLAKNPPRVDVQVD